MAKPHRQNIDLELPGNKTILVLFNKRTLLIYWMHLCSLLRIQNQEDV